MARKAADMLTDSTPHASLSNDEADQAGPFLFLGSEYQTYEQFIGSLEMAKMDFRGYSHADAVAVVRQFGCCRFQRYLASAFPERRGLSGARFATAVCIAQLDEALSVFLFKCITPIEIALRSVLAQEFTLSYGARAFDNQSIFKDQELYARLQEALGRELQQGRHNKAPFLLEGLRRYDALPAWMAVELTSFGTLSKLYGNLADAGLSKTIAKAFGVRASVLANWLKYLTQIRNMCAHHDVFYNRILPCRPRLFSEYRHLDDCRLFVAFVVIFRMLEAIDEPAVHAARCELDGIIGNYSTVDLRPLGFPSDWRSVLKLPTEELMAAPRPRGRGGGRPTKSRKDIDEALYLYDIRDGSVLEIAKRTGVSTSTIYKYVRLRDAQRAEQVLIAEHAQGAEQAESAERPEGVQDA